MKVTSSLKETKAFTETYRKGKAYGNEALVLFVKKNGLPGNRLGISISKKCGNSVVRHRFIRQIREINRLHEGELARGYDLVVVAKKGRGDLYSEKKNFRILEASFLKLADRAGIRS